MRAHYKWCAEANARVSIILKFYCMHAVYGRLLFGPQYLQWRSIKHFIRLKKDQALVRICFFIRANNMHIRLLIVPIQPRVEDKNQTWQLFHKSVECFTYNNEYLIEKFVFISDHPLVCCCSCPNVQIQAETFSVYTSMSISCSRFIRQSNMLILSH